MYELIYILVHYCIYYPHLFGPKPANARNKLVFFCFFSYYFTPLPGQGLRVLNK